MTGSTRSSADLDSRRRALLFRCWHRGSREMDLILGRFADAWIEQLSERELADFEQLILLPDPDLYAWIAGHERPPMRHDCALLQRLRAFHSPPRDPT